MGLENAEKLVVQKSRRQPQSSVTVRRFRKRKSCCHVIAIPQAGISAPTLTVMQGFQAKKRLLHAFSFPSSEYCVYTPYTSIPLVRNPSANLRWLEGDHYTTPIATMQCQNAVFKLNV